MKFKIFDVDWKNDKVDHSCGVRVSGGGEIKRYYPEVYEWLCKTFGDYGNMSRDKWIKCCDRRYYINRNRIFFKDKSDLTWFMLNWSSLF